jgi:hypothetical protein
MISRIQPWQNTLLDNMGVIEAMRRGGMVRRYHTHPYVIGEQTVAQHTFNMACLCLALHPDPKSNLLAAILMHDVPEAAVGDVPSPAKWANDDLRKALDDSENAVLDRFFIRYDLTVEETHWLRFLDLFEGAMFARDQIIMGNVGCQIVFELFIGSILKLKLNWQIELGFQYWPEDLETECKKLIQHYTSLTGEHIEWM